MEGPLFCHMNNQNLTRYQFSKMLRNALAFTGYSRDELNTHSLRIGAATQSFLNDKWSMEIIMLQTVYSVEYVTLNFL